MRFIITFLLSAMIVFGVGFLMPEEAFKPRISQIDTTTIGIEIELGDQIYLYKDKIKVEDADPNDGIDFKSVKMNGKVVDHEGEKVYESSPSVRIPLLVTKEVSGKKKVKVKLSYQGCSSAGLCYEPIDTTLDISVDTALLPSSVKKEEVSQNVEETPQTLPMESVKTLEATEPIASRPKASKAENSGSETDQIADVIKGGSIWFIILSFFGFGLLLSLTPCVFPMIPIISSVIVAQGEGIGTRRAFSLSLVYVLSMSIAYTTAGILAGSFGANLQSAFQTPWIITAFALIFVALAMSMFDLYELQLPNFIQSRLTQAGGKRGGVIGVAIMGFLSALIVGPCVAAPLAGALIYIGQTGDALLGGIALFSLSIGMGMPLLAVGTTAGKFMPKPGAWMDAIKSIFGIMLLGVAIWMISRVIDENMTMLLWGGLAVFVAINLGALEPIAGNTSWSLASNRKAIGVMVLLYGMSLLLGGMAGSKSPLHPLDPFIVSNKVAIKSSSTGHKPFEVIRTNDELNALLEQNKGKKILVDFSAEWCTSCKEYDEITFADETVATAMNEFVLIRVDLTGNTEEGKAVSKRFGLFGPPAILFFDQEGTHLKDKDIIGYKDPQAFLAHLKSL